MFILITALQTGRLNRDAPISLRGEPLREAVMNVPIREKHTPDPKCCFCGLRPRRTRGNDALRLVIVVLLLLPMILML